MAKVCSTAVANSSKVPSSRQILIHAMNFASAEVFSVTYILECILLESVKLNQFETNCEATSPTADIHSSHSHEFIITWSLFWIMWMKPTGRATAWIKKPISCSDVWDQQYMDVYLKYHVYLSSLFLCFSVEVCLFQTKCMKTKEVPRNSNGWKQLNKQAN